MIPWTSFAFHALDLFQLPCPGILLYFMHWIYLFYCGYHIQGPSMSANSFGVRVLDFFQLSCPVILFWNDVQNLLPLLYPVPLLVITPWISCCYHIQDPIAPGALSAAMPWTSALGSFRHHPQYTLSRQGPFFSCHALGLFQCNVLGLFQLSCPGPLLAVMSWASLGCYVLGLFQLSWPGPLLAVMCWASFSCHALGLFQLSCPWPLLAVMSWASFHWPPWASLL